MSTLVMSQAVGEDLPPLVGSDLLEYFHEGAKPEADWRIGAEFEKFALHRSTGKPLQYAEPGGIRDLLKVLVDRFDWEPHFETGQLSTLSKHGATVSLEPGGQVEFATPPMRTVHELAAELRNHLAELQSLSDFRHVQFVSAGVLPTCATEDVALGIRRRHKVMAEYLPPRGSMAMHMMKATASTQVAFDYSDEADAATKFTVALTLSPVVNALWANSPAYAGRSTGWASYRGSIWLGMDPDRCGLLVPLLKKGLSFQTWIDYLLDMPMLFEFRDAEYHPANGCTFRRFLTHGLNGRFPTKADWEIHLTTVFPEARMKHFLEIRGADANPEPLALAVPALWKGLLYDTGALEAAAALAKRFPPEDLNALSDAAHRQSLAAEYRGRTLADWGRELVKLAAEGLKNQSKRSGQPSEVDFLDPVFAILDRGVSPGSAWLAKANGHAPSLPELLKEFG